MPKGCINGMAILLTGILALSSWAADPPAPPAPSIVFPKRPVVPNPMPPAPPVPGGVFVLAGDLLYVVDCKVDTVLRAHPARLVTAKKLKGPVTIYGKFADGSGALEDRTYSGPVVYVLTAAGTGTVDLDAIPVGFKDEKDIVSETIQVDSGHAPQPPPGPNPPGPQPPPKPPEPVKTFRVFLIFESGNTPTPAEKAVLEGKAVEEWLTAKCTGGKAGWRRRDKDNDGGSDSAEMKALWAAIQPKITAVPCVAVAVNEKVEIIPIEATPEAMIAKLKTYRGE